MESLRSQLRFSQWLHCQKHILNFLQYTVNSTLRTFFHNKLHREKFLKAMSCTTKVKILLWEVTLRNIMVMMAGYSRKLHIEIASPFSAKPFELWVYFFSFFYIITHNFVELYLSHFRCPYKMYQGQNVPRQNVPRDKTSQGTKAYQETKHPTLIIKFSKANFVLKNWPHMLRNGPHPCTQFMIGVFLFWWG